MQLFKQGKIIPQHWNKFTFNYDTVLQFKQHKKTQYIHQIKLMSLMNKFWFKSNNIKSVTSLDINAKGISDLTGIEDFTSLVQLLSYQNNLSSVNLSMNIYLEYFRE